MNNVKITINNKILCFFAIGGHSSCFTASDSLNEMPAKYVFANEIHLQLWYREKLFKFSFVFGLPFHLFTPHAYTLTTTITMILIMKNCSQCLFLLYAIYILEFYVDNIDAETSNTNNNNSNDYTNVHELAFSRDLSTPIPCYLNTVHIFYVDLFS